jgi:hypothetical protein
MLLWRLAIVNLEYGLAHQNTLHDLVVSIAFIFLILSGSSGSDSVESVLVLDFPGLFLLVYTNT